MILQQNFLPYAETYSANKIVSIDNFLQEDAANHLHDYFMHLPDYLWDVAYKPKFPNQHEVKNTEVNKPFTARILAQCHAVAKAGEFAMFRFSLRAEPHSIDPYVKAVSNLFSSIAMQSAVRDVTGLDVQLHHSQLSRMEPGHFLGSHLDTGSARLAFVYHLSKNWKREYGGVFMDETDPMNFREVLPVFNRLVLFDKRDHTKPHSVSPVAHDSPLKRLVITGHFI